MGPADRPAPAGGARRRALVAALLGLFAGVLAQVYCGRLRRALVFEVVFALVCVAGLTLLLYLPVSHLGLAAAALLVGGWRLFVIADAVRLARRPPAPPRFYQDVSVYVLGFVMLSAVELALVWEAGRTWVWPLRISSPAMADAVLPGDRIVVDRLAYRFGPVAYGDVVAFSADLPLRPWRVLRVAGLPGDEVEIRRERLYRNGQPVDEPYVKREGPQEEGLANFGPEVVPEGCLFLLGDNRRASFDSRLAAIGFVPVEDVLGRVAVVYWSNEFRVEPGNDPDPEKHVRLGPVRWGRLGLRVGP
jgi:signal peptidase I